MTTDYGIDLVCWDDLDEAMSEADSVCAYVYRRITTRKGSLIDDPDWGIDVLEMLSGKADIASIRAQIVAELSDDDRVQITAVDLFDDQPWLLLEDHV